jgi:hypothetical protein
MPGSGTPRELRNRLGMLFVRALLLLWQENGQNRSCTSRFSMSAAISTVRIAIAATPPALQKSSYLRHGLLYLPAEAANQSHDASERQN